MNRTEIVNYALALVGGQRITSLDDGTLVANRCKNLLPISESKVLRAFDWPSMTTRGYLARTTGVDTAPYLYAYTVPECSKFLGLTTDDRYLIEGQLLFTDLEAPVGRWVQAPALEYLDHGLAESIALHLASRLAVDLAQDQAKKGQLYQEYLAVLRAATQDAATESEDDGPDTIWW